MKNMRKDISRRVKSMLVVIIMLLTALTVTVSSTTVTNNNALATIKLYEDKNVLVMNFTVSAGGADTIVNNHDGTDDAVAGDILIAFGTSGKYYDEDSSVSYNVGDEVFIDDDSDGVYTAQIDVLLAGSTTNLGAGDALSTTVIADWQGTLVGSVSYYDAVDGDAWNAAADAIWEEGTADDAYTDAGDTLLAGIAPAESTAETGDGGKDSDWTTVNLYDHADGAVWDATNDAIIEDFHAGGTYSAAADTQINAGEGTTFDMSDGDQGEDLDESTYYACDVDDSGTINLADEIAIDEDDNGIYNGDELNAITIENIGTATNSDFDNVYVWADDAIAGFFGVALQEDGEASNWNTLNYYDAIDDDAWDTTSDAIWKDETGGTDDTYDDGTDTLLAGTAPADTTVATGAGAKDSYWALIKTYDAVEDSGAWDDSADAIVLDYNDDDTYDQDDKFLAGSQGATELGTMTWDSTDEYWYLSGLSQSITDSGQTFFVTVDISSSGAGKTIQMKIPAYYDYDSDGVYDQGDGDKGLFLASSFENSAITNANIQTIGKLGVNYFEGTEQGAVDVIITDIKNLRYGLTTDIVVDTSQLTDGQIYYLYYPYYVRTGTGGSYTYELRWEAVMTGGGEQVSIDGSKTSDTMQSISLDCAGMWILDNDTNPSDASLGTDGDFAYFWVNNNSPYTIEYTPSSVYYGKNETVQIIVKEEGETVGAWIDIFRESDNSRVFHTWESDGTFSFNSDWLNNLSYTGNYTINAYTDVDVTQIGYGVDGYSENYGYTNPSITATNYSALCGPWDPYEKNATEKTIRVKTGEPNAAVAAGNSTMYWGFSGEVNITIVGYDGENLIGADATLDVKALNEEDTDITSETSLTIDSSNIDKGYIQIISDSWGKNDIDTYGENGTWYVYIYLNKDSDSGANEYTEEWNATVEWTVAAGPATQFKWIDDDGTVGGVDLWGSQKSNNDGIIPYIPTATNVPLDVEFYVYGEDGTFFGSVDNAGSESGTCITVDQCATNITISGDSLFTGKLSDFPGYGLEPLNCGYSSGVWSVPIIPTMSLGGGEITIEVTAFNSSVTEKISIGGGNYETNGSIVSVTPNEFMIDQENKTLTITVQNSETGVENPYMSIYLYYLDDGTITAANKPITDHIVDRVEAVGGVYTISFNTTQQTDNQTLAEFDNVMAPRNLTIYVSGPGHREGYALIQMKPVNDLETHISVETFMAGLDYDDVVISCDFVNGTAGKSDTDTPSTETDDKDSFFMKIVDETGDDVTGTTSSDGVLRNFYDDVLTGAYSVERDNVYGLDAGTYSIYAWNNTHNSEGHNATFEIKAVDVICDKAPFIWSVDANISATFTITYNGNPVNGTFRIDNMSDKGTYNSTWRNCSFTGTSDVGGNTSLEISKTKIINGVVTVHDISADKLHPNVAKQYITFWFKPTESGSVFAKATAQMNVEVPSITPDPMYIPLGRTTKVYCTATGRGETLNDVFIRLHGQGFDQNSTTDVDGRVVFSVTPASTGNISIDVGETGRTLTDTVVYVVAWIIDVDVVAEVDEGEQFTVTVTKEGTTDVVVDATVTIKGIGTATTDANGEVTFVAPDVTSDRTYTIKVTAEGYAPDPDGLSITVINTPRLIIVLPDKVQATTTFNVAVADDTGSAIVGVTITFNEKTYTTGVNGVAKLTAPKTKGDYPIKATFGNYVATTDIVTVTAVPGIPGFELLSLIVALLGVAFILLRRRRR